MDIEKPSAIRLAIPRIITTEMLRFLPGRTSNHRKSSNYPVYAAVHKFRKIRPVKCQEKAGCHEAYL